ncbi:hypothetical protein B0H13DRAFT_1934086 [Mycena leptocephala]|nr:hypothetical protein B0H13DRAFT_1934086 [Mycena leptocephala]
MPNTDRGANARGANASEKSKANNASEANDARWVNAEVRPAFEAPTLVRPRRPTAEKLAIDALPWIYRFLLVVGICATGVGYIGCFTVVQNSSTRQTLVWLGVKTFLCLLRLFFWGLNPDWDNETYIMLAVPGTAPTPPSTTEVDFAEIASERKPFVSIRDHDVLRQMRAHTGAVPRFMDPDHHITLFYTITRGPENNSLSLLTTAIDLQTQTTFVLAQTPDNDDTTFFSATLRVSETTGITETTIEEKIERNPHQLLNSKQFVDIERHSQALINLFKHPELRVNWLRVSWAGQRLEIGPTN